MDGGGWERAHELEQENAQLRKVLLLVYSLLQAGQAGNALDYIDGFLAGLIEREKLRDQH